MKKLLLMSAFILCTQPAQAGFFSGMFGTSLSAQEKAAKAAQEKQKDEQFTRQLNRISTSNTVGNVLFTGVSVMTCDAFKDYITENAEPLSNGARSLFNDRPSIAQFGVVANILQQTAADAMIIGDDKIVSSFEQNYADETTRAVISTDLLYATAGAFTLLGSLHYGLKGITALQAHNARNFIRKELPAESRQEQTARLNRWQTVVQEKKAGCWTNSCTQQMDSIAAFLDKTDRKNNGT